MLLCYFAKQAKKLQFLTSEEIKRDKNNSFFSIMQKFGLKDPLTEK